jgi:hypothetical protein
MAVGRIQIAEPFAQQPASDSHGYDSPAGQETGRQHDGEQIQKAQRKVGFGPPIEDCNRKDDECAGQQNGRAVPSLPDPFQVGHERSVEIAIIPRILRYAIPIKRLVRKIRLR